MENLKKICSNCGAEMPETAVFCEKCGTKVVVPETPKKRFCSMCGTEISETALFCGQCGEKTTYEEEFEEITEEVVVANCSSYTCELKRFTGSPLFLVLAILVSVSGIVGIVDFNIISFVTYILLITGSWVLWAKSKKENGDPTGGIKTIKAAVKLNQVIAIIGAIALAVALGIVVIASIVGVGFAEDLFDTNLTTVIAGILVLGGIIVSATFVLISMYYKSILGFLNSLLYSMKKEEDYASQKAMFPAILIFIFSVFPFIGSLLKIVLNSIISEVIFELSSELPSEVYELLIDAVGNSTKGTIVTLLGAAVAIFGGVLLILYKNKFNKNNN